MRRTSPFSWFLTILALCALALGLLTLPKDFAEPIRQSIRDVSHPGQTLTRICVQGCRSVWGEIRGWQARRAEVSKLQAQLKQALARNAEYQQRLTDTSERLQQAELRPVTGVTGNSSDPLFVPELIVARVLGQETVALAAGRKLLGVGKAQGVGDNLLVIEPGLATLDIGEDLGITLHQPVFAGEVVLGRTANCGRVSCALQPVTDAGFRGPAQLLKKTDSGWQSGPEGVVEGTGKGHCLLTGISSREAVEVGDEVYTPAADPLLPHPMFYGRVISAELKTGTSQWEIVVEPAAAKVRSTFVKILRAKENAVRMTAN